ncbi:tenascin-like [Frankliniella occidentalis]|uniref:Tenascin-like n=1 Tax=Frankliniella occidentalis TaxID=133901 RepID=A0A9C6XS28_FRAOC|nr:tenascin-like [Frankliniella occidentalis]
MPENSLSEYHWYIWTIPARAQHRTSITFDYTRIYHCHLDDQLTVKVFMGKPMQSMKLNYTSTQTTRALVANEEEVRVELYAYSPCGGTFTFTGAYTVEPFELRTQTTIASITKGARLNWCANGGGLASLETVVDNDVKCICPPGFGGDRCEKACGSNRYGKSCEQKCSDEPAGCWGVKFCSAEFCTCATGLAGEYCRNPCKEGFYGANCTERCGHCREGGSCDIYSGHCPNGCLSGYIPPTCQNALPHVLEPLTVIAVDPTKIVGEFRVPVSVADPSLRMRYYEILCQVVGTDTWRSLSLNKLQIPANLSATFRVAPVNDDDEYGSFQDDARTAQVYDMYSNSTYLESFVATGLPPGEELYLSVLLLNEDLEAYRSVPHSYVRTPVLGRLSNLKVTSVTSRSIQITWNAAQFKHGEFFYVVTECLSVAGCSGPCSQPSTTQAVATMSALLDRLVPGAKYRITVWSGAEELNVVVNTALEVPQGKVSSLRFAARTNSSALFTWEPDTQCEMTHGPISHYGYCFESTGSKESGCDASRATNTSRTTVAIMELQPLTDYKFSVIQYNPAGSNAGIAVAAINFTTHHTVPDPPRELDVYRLNRTALWLRWLPPGRPSGALRWYTVEVAPVVTPGSAKPKHRSERVAAGTRCPAWPDHVCYIVGRLRPRVTYLITVSATNEHGDLPGEHATVQATTDKKVSEPPQDLQAVDITERTALIRWKLPSKLNSDLTYFEVAVARRLFSDEEEVGEDSEDPDPRRVPATAELPQYEYPLDGLQPGATYTATVSCGYGGKTSIVDFTTRLSDEEQFLDNPEEGKEKM